MVPDHPMTRSSDVLRKPLKDPVKIRKAFVPDDDLSFVALVGRHAHAHAKRLAQAAIGVAQFEVNPLGPSVLIGACLPLRARPWEPVEGTSSTLRRWQCQRAS